MTHQPRRSLVALAAAAASVTVLTAALVGPVSAQSPAKTQITVVSLIPGTEQAAFDAFDAQVAQFEAANPDIDITPQEYEWTGPTFTAMLAGGTLPDVFTIPFTDGQSLIEQGQLADMSAQIGALPYASKFNPNVLTYGQDKDGKIFAVPTAGVRHRAAVQP